MLRTRKQKKTRGEKGKMRKLIFLLSIVMILGVFFSYGFSENVGNDVLTGLSVETSIAKSKSAGEEDGLAQANVVIVAVTIDESGKITNCVIDTAQTKSYFSKEGKMTTPLDTIYVGKLELGEDYGMIANSAIGKEWNEQSDALSDYVIGKTIEEVKGIALNEESRAIESELASSVTISLSNYIAGIEKAVANAENRGAGSEDKLGIGVVTTLDHSKDATADEEGVAQAYSNIAVVTFDNEGVITSCIIDAVQANVNFNQSGEVTTDLSTIPKTKNELGADYGMIANSDIGKEWDEQADAFAKYVVGKTVEEVTGISLNEEGYPAEAELSSSVTVHIGPFMENIEKAFNAAK